MSKIELQEQMFKSVEACNQSGLSRRAFCLANDIVEGQFYYWARKYNKHKNPVQGFVKITSEGLSKGSGSIEIFYPNGVKVTVGSSTSRSDLNKIVSCW